MANRKGKGKDDSEENDPDRRKVSMAETFAAVQSDRLSAEWRTAGMCSCGSWHDSQQMTRAEQTTNLFRTLVCILTFQTRSLFNE